MRSQNSEDTEMHHFLEQAKPTYKKSVQVLTYSDVEDYCSRSQKLAEV